MSGIGKKTVLKAVAKQPLTEFGKDETSEEDFIDEGKQFVATCFSRKSVSSLENHKLTWERRTAGAKLTSKHVALKYLPPTDPVLELNIKQARHTRMIWGSSPLPDPLSSNPCNPGWSENYTTETLHPMMIPSKLQLAPGIVLKVAQSRFCTSGN